MSSLKPVHTSTTSLWLSIWDAKTANILMTMKSEIIVYISEQILIIIVLTGSSWCLTPLEPLCLPHPHLWPRFSALIECSFARCPLRLLLKHGTDTIAAHNICKGYSVRTRGGSQNESLVRSSVGPIMFAQDIPQEALTTGNVCPASSLFHACKHAAIHAHSMETLYRQGYSTVNRHIFHTQRRPVDNAAFLQGKCICNIEKCNQIRMNSIQQKLAVFSMF